MRLAAEGPGPPGYIISCMLLGIVREVVGLVGNGNERKWGCERNVDLPKVGDCIWSSQPQRSFLSVGSIQAFVSKLGWLRLLTNRIYSIYGVAHVEKCEMRSTTCDLFLFRRF